MATCINKSQALYNLLYGFWNEIERCFDFFGKRFNNLKKITLNFTPYCAWINRFYIHGSTLTELFEKRATVLWSVAIVIDDGTNEKFHEHLSMEGGFESLHLLNQLTNLELTNVCIQCLQLLTTLASTDQLVSLKLYKMRLYQCDHNNFPFTVSTWD